MNDPGLQNLHTALLRARNARRTEQLIVEVDAPAAKLEASIVDPQSPYTTHSCLVYRYHALRDYRRFKTERREGAIAPRHPISPKRVGWHNTEKHSRSKVKSADRKLF